jgi:hypothetical protein
MIYSSASRKQVLPFKMAGELKHQLLGRKVSIF